MKTFVPDSSVQEDAITRARRVLSERHADIDIVMKRVSSAYFGTARDRALEAELDNLFSAFLMAGGTGEATPWGARFGEGRALTLIGSSGAGKSRALDRLFRNREEFSGYGVPGSDCMLISVTAPSPCTLRLLGMSVLAALGYQTTRELRENVVWDLVKHQLLLRGVCFLHIDELQHVQQSRNALEITKVQDTLKGLMQNREWPVWLILSGLPGIATLLSSDEQVWRRTRHVVFEDLHLHNDDLTVRRMLELFGKERAALSINDVVSDEFIARLLHAAVCRFGIVVEFIQDAVQQALLLGDTDLKTEHFATVFAARTGCSSELNVFTAATTEWHLIDPRDALKSKLLGAGSSAEGEPKNARQKAPRDIRNK